MRQGSILGFLQSQTPEATDPKGTDPTVTVSAVTVLGTAGPIRTKTSGQGSSISVRNDLRTASQPGLSLEINPPLHDSRVSIMRVLPSHLDRLKSITATLLPVRYSDKFFTECLEPEKHSIISFAALYDSQLVGWIRCRVEPFPNAENEVYQQIYVQALGILAPFRGLGLAAELLKSVRTTGCAIYPKVRSIYAHVWERNEDALAWYDKQDFKRIMLQPQYYRRLKPSGAWVVRRELE